MRSIGPMLAVALMLGSAAAGRAQVADAPCAPPAELAGWMSRHPVVAATHAGGDQMPVLAIGDAVDLALAPVGKVGLAAPLGRAAAEGDRAGLVSFRVALSGTYRIALGGHAWIDVVATGVKPLPSVAHGPGPACAGVAKHVDFQLEPGVYVLQLSAADADHLPVMIARLP